MAIPGRTWSGASLDREQGDVDPAFLADRFSALSDPTRVAILQTLARERALAYSALRETVGVRDKGRFNYHLRKLTPFIEQDDGEYVLTTAGEQVIERALLVTSDEEKDSSPSV